MKKRKSLKNLRRVRGLIVARILCKIFEKNERLGKLVETQKKLIKNQDEMIECYKKMMATYDKTIAQRDAIIDKLQSELETLKRKG